MTTFTAIKDPQDTVNYTIRWHNWLNGDTISTSAWAVSAGESPISLTVDTSSIGDYTDVSPILADTTAVVVVSGGTMGIVYTLTNHIVTAGGLESDRSITVKMYQK